jgi:hypothetical protein
MPTRYLLRCPSQAVHGRALELVPQFGRVVVDNRKRLSISAEIEDERLLSNLEELGVEVFPEERHDPE